MQTILKAIMRGSVACIVAASVLPGVSHAKGAIMTAPRLPACHAAIERAAFLPADPAPGCAAQIATDKVVRDHRALRS